MKLKKSTVLPIVLLCYLGLMSYIGYPDYATGKSSGLYYFGIIGTTIVVIILLHFSLKRRERLASERRADINTQLKQDSHETKAEQ